MKPGPTMLEGIALELARRLRAELDVEASLRAESVSAAAVIRKPGVPAFRLELRIEFLPEEEPEG